jgi:Glycosyl transferases group 1
MKHWHLYMSRVTFETSGSWQCATMQPMFLSSLFWRTTYRIRLESMACGAPVIAFETSEIPEMVTHLKNGLLVKRKDAQALAE